ncbi:hypothetical protein D7B24_003303 [Verticillium nonalfalfae]|uniref:Uncharacterized protein n=1 Tax=Verticillium nonalfalfae TaxID=1051616 RepID=A0A3M9Y0A8_9PEZI|nr:uncharacterized protein D7B24_003303 [Verticillium nonalfalfae]RNJ52560.1 hypothetical protein D7B24_003303 [Verticillium nonalfalfae]
MASSSLPDPRMMPKKMPAIASKLGAFSLAQPASHKKTTAVQERMDETKRALRELVRAEQDLAKKLGTTTEADKQAMQARLEELETHDAEQAKLVSGLQVLKANASALEAACNRIMTKERLSGTLDYTFTPETTLLIAGFQLVSVGGLEALFASNAEVERDLQKVVAGQKGSAATSSELVKELLRIAKHPPPLCRGMEQGLDSVEMSRQMKKNVDLQKARRDATAEARKHRLTVEAYKMSIKEAACVLKRGLRADDDLAERDQQILQLRQELAKARQRAENLDEELANSQKFQDEDPRDADNDSEADGGDDRRLQETEEVLRGVEIELGAERATVKARNATIAALEGQATAMQRQLQLAFDAQDSAERRTLMVLVSGNRIEADERPRASFSQVTPWAPGSHELAMPSMGASNTSVVALQVLAKLADESPEAAIFEHAWVLWSLLRQGRDLETGLAGVIADQLVTRGDRSQPLVLGIWQLLVEFARWPCLTRYLQQFLDMLAPNEPLLWVLNAARSDPETLRGACRDVEAVLYLEETPERDEMAFVSHPTWPMVLHVSFAGGWMRYVADVRFGLASLTLRGSADGTALQMEWADLVTPL